MQGINKVNFAVILGSGLDAIAGFFPSRRLISEDKSGIHRKRVFLAEADKSRILLFCGRRHYYEGYSAREITASIDDASAYGVKYILLTNAAGGLNVNFEESDLMLINSHVNFNSKLQGKRTEISYNKTLMERFTETCSELKVKIHNGVYACLPGPAYETCSEISFLKRAGADAAGMSTVPEMLYGFNLGIKMLAVSVITNILVQNIPSVTSHSGILKTSQKASEKLFFVVKSFANELK
jgi:purine-nucleoside phosphorylase